MREARIILPVPVAHTADERRPQIEAQVWFQDALCALAGGFTLTKGVGGWTPPSGPSIEENILIYDIAIQTQPNPSPHERALRALAEELGRKTGQASVYFRAPSGLVEFLKIEEA